MNRIPATVTNIEHVDLLSRLDLRAGRFALHAITLQLSPHITPNCSIDAIFRSSEVALVKGVPATSSHDNHIPGVVTEIHAGRILSNVRVASSVGTIQALVTSEALERMSLCVGDEVQAQIKATSVTVVECDSSD